MVETLLGPPLHHANLNRQLREVEEDALSFLDDSESRQHYPLGPQCSFANPNSLFLGHASSSGPYDSDDRLIHVRFRDICHLKMSLDALIPKTRGIKHA